MSRIIPTISGDGRCMTCNRPIVLMRTREQLGVYEPNEHDQLVPHQCPDESVDRFIRILALRRLASRMGARP